MSSTHYMDLLMLNSPWNLIIFMAIPVVLAESIAISELYMLWSEPRPLPNLQRFKAVCGVLAGLAFLGIIIYFIPYVVIPLCQSGGWRTWIDVVAIVSYLASGIPMMLIALLNLGILFRNHNPKTRSLYHIVFLAAFLVLSHVAMIFGMVDPSIAGWKPTGQEHMHGNMQAPMEQMLPAGPDGNMHDHQHMQDNMQHTHPGSKEGRHEH